MTDLVALEAQFRALVLDGFDLEDAWRLGSALVDAGHARSLPIAVDIHMGRHQAFHAALPGSTPENDDWIARKRRVAEITGLPSFLVGRRAAAEQVDWAAVRGLSDREVATHGGAVPIVVRGVGPVGVVTVSGLPQHEDHALAVATIAQVFDIDVPAAGD
jgi:uncharacterized protein (UPF0303 family)